MNEKTSKKILLFLVICILGTLIFLFCIIIAGIILSKNISRSNKFSASREDFEIVEKIIMEDYEQNMQSYPKDGVVDYEIIHSDDTGLYSYKYCYSDTIVEIDSKYTAAIENIYTTYSNLTTDIWYGYIAIRGNEFIFWNYEKGDGQVIHSLNGQIPSGAIGTKNYNRETNLYFLGKDWYVYTPTKHHR